MSVEERLTSSGPKKLLALDGGGLRALISLGFLARIESLLREQAGNPTLVLSDYFDYIAGTSTGALVATALSLGLTVDAIVEFYLDQARAIFSPSRLTDRLYNKYGSQGLVDAITRVIGADTKLGSANVRTLLMLCMRNATTNSPWPISNNPRAMFNDPSLPACNLELPLWQLLRASTAAPSYFPPEVIDVGGERFVFVDGAITVYNNPAFLLFRMATLAPYRVQWAAAEDRLLLTSIGTGLTRNPNAQLTPAHMNLLYTAEEVPAALIYSAGIDQDVNCRMFGKLRYGPQIDSEIGDLLEAPPPGERNLFTYMRYDVDLSREGLDALGMHDVDPQAVQALDAVDRLDTLREIGNRAADQHVRMDHFDGFFEVTPTT